ncbi:hypothetical protein HDE_06469 [Halotydeus destructor]|nr:hypothetical protein HDE_06469 [Halotydeus destructor]
MEVKRHDVGVMMLICLLFAVFICSSESLKCWNCTNVGVDGWKDCINSLPDQPKTDDQKPYFIDCSTDERLMNLTVPGIADAAYLCRLQVQSINSAESGPAGTENIGVRVRRSCGLNQNEKKGCKNINSPAVRERSCQCLEDGCNSQNSSRRLNSCSWLYAVAMFLLVAALV